MIYIYIYIYIWQCAFNVLLRYRGSVRWNWGAHKKCSFVHGGAEAQQLLPNRLGRKLPEEAQDQIGQAAAAAKNIRSKPKCDDW